MPTKIDLPVAKKPDDVDDSEPAWIKATMTLARSQSPFPSPEVTDEDVDNFLKQVFTGWASNRRPTIPVLKDKPLAKSGLVIGILNKDVPSGKKRNHDGTPKIEKAHAKGSVVYGKPILEKGAARAWYVDSNNKRVNEANIEWDEEEGMSPRLWIELCNHWDACHLEYRAQWYLELAKFLSRKHIAGNRSLTMTPVKNGAEPTEGEFQPIMSIGQSLGEQRAFINAVFDIWEKTKGRWFPLTICVTSAMDPTEEERFKDFSLDGDVIFVVGEQKKARLKVNSQYLCCASTVFRAMFGPNWSEGQGLSKESPKELPLVEDDPDAMSFTIEMIWCLRKSRPSNFSKSPSPPTSMTSLLPSPSRSPSGSNAG
ncbi:hypothetical protein PG984_009182 [Apiospora sp. TS-2023a]